MTFGYFLFLHVSIESYALEYTHKWIWYGFIYDDTKNSILLGTKILKDMEKLKLQFNNTNFRFYEI